MLAKLWMFESGTGCRVRVSLIYIQQDNFARLGSNGSQDIVVCTNARFCHSACNGLQIFLFNLSSFPFGPLKSCYTSLMYRMR